MRAAIFRGVGRPLSIESVPDPTPGPFEVVIKVARCGICGTDLHMTADDHLSYPIGTALGHEYAGEVVGVGLNVKSEIQVGDRVTAQPMAGCGTCDACLHGEPYWCDKWRSMMGGFGEYTLADARSVAKLPGSLSLADAALVEPLAASLNGVLLAGLTEGARVLVLGAGSMGLGSIFWLRHMGCGKIIAAARSNRNRRLALGMGADAFIMTGQNVEEELNVLLGGSPDFVFDCVGAPGVLELAARCVRRRGAIVGLGMCMHRDQWTPAVAMGKQLRVQFGAAYNMAHFRRSIEALDENAAQLSALVSATVSLDELPQAFEDLRHGSKRCKVMVNPANSSPAENDSTCGATVSSARRIG